MDDRAPEKELLEARDRLQEREREMSALQEELQRLQKEVIFDPETALHSSAYFHARLKEEVVRSERYRHFLSLILVHVELKDRQSTQQITREVSRIGRELMGGITRRNDIVALYTKRQMVVMLPETDPRGARLLVHRIQSSFPSNGRRMSYGVISYPNDATNIELVFNRLHNLSENLFRGEPTGEDSQG